MKKILGLLCVLFSFGVTFATVGGPSLIGNIYYDQLENSIRYNKTFYDGLGGSEVHKYSISQQKDEIITTLETLEFAEGRLMSETSSLEAYFKKNTFTPLKEFQLNKIPVKISLSLKYFNQLINNESFEIAKVTPHPFVDDGNEYMMSGYIFNFIWDNKVSIENQVKSTIEISTCRLNPINYRGFGITGLDTIVIIATAEKRDCMEGGYLGEDVHILSGINIDNTLFLDQNSTGLSRDRLNETRKFETSTGGLQVNPQMTGDNEVFGTGKIKTIETPSIETKEMPSFFQRIRDYIKKIIGSFSS